MDREIPKFDEKHTTLKEAFCSKCGLLYNAENGKDFRSERWVCDCVYTRVEVVLGVSQRLRSWNDVMGKLARLYCLNQYETQSGFEPDDEILERTDDYVLIRDSRGLLLIVIHDEESHDLIDKMKDTTQKPVEKMRVCVFSL